MNSSSYMLIAQKVSRYLTQMELAANSEVADPSDIHFLYKRIKQEQAGLLFCTHGPGMTGIEVGHNGGHCLIASRMSTVTSAGIQKPRNTVIVQQPLFCYPAWIGLQPQSGYEFKQRQIESKQGRRTNITAGLYPIFWNWNLFIRVTCAIVSYT